MSEDEVTTDDINMRQAGIYCVNNVPSDTAEEAWAEFIKKFRWVCTWYRGRKYWRVKPELGSRVDFETSKTGYRVYARITTLLGDNMPVEMEEAIFRHNGIEYKWSDYPA